MKTILEELIAAAQGLVSACNESECPTPAIRLRQAIVAASDLLRQITVRNDGRVLELISYRDRQLTPYEELFYHSAKAKCEDGNIEVDTGTAVSGSDDDGEYIMAWLWVANDDVVFPWRFEGTVSYQTAAGETHQLGQGHVLDWSESSARQKLLDQFWDPRLEAAGCSPITNVVAAARLLHHVHIEFAGEAGDAVYTVRTNKPEDALEAIRLLHDVDGEGCTSLRITNDDGEQWRLENGRLITQEEIEAAESDVEAG